MKTLQLLITIKVPDNIKPEQISMSKDHEGYYLGAYTGEGEEIDISTKKSTYELVFCASVPEPVYVLFGIDAVTEFENEGLKGLAKAIRKNEVSTFELQEFQANASPVEVLYATDGWNGYAILTKKEFQKLQKL